MKGALTVLVFWGCSALICLPALFGGSAAYLALTFLILLLGFSAYLYSPRFATFVDDLLRRTKAI